MGNLVQQSTEKLIADLKARLPGEEDVRKFAYDDESAKELKRGMTLKGNLTIGVGRNLSAIGLREDEIQLMLHNDVIEAIMRMRSVFLDFDLWTHRRRVAVTDMMFNMGIETLLGFRKTIKAIRSSKWDEAAKEAADSKWYKQTGARAMALVDMIREG